MKRLRQHLVDEFSAVGEDGIREFHDSLLKRNLQQLRVAAFALMLLLGFMLPLDSFLLPGLLSSTLQQLVWQTDLALLALLFVLQALLHLFPVSASHSIRWFHRLLFLLTLMLVMVWSGVQSVADQQLFHSQPKFILALLLIVILFPLDGILMLVLELVGLTALLVASLFFLAQPIQEILLQYLPILGILPMAWILSLQRYRVQLSTRLRKQELDRTRLELQQEGEQRGQAVAQLREREQDLLHLQRGLSRLSGLNLQDENDLRDALGRLVLSVQETLPDLAIGIWLVSGDRQQLRLVLRRLPDGSESQDLVFDVATQGAYARQLLRGEIIAESDVANSPRLADWAREHLLPYQLRAIIDVPVLAKGQVAGVLSMAATKVHEWTTDEWNFAGGVSQIAGLILTNHDRLLLENALRRLEGEIEEQVALRTQDLARSNYELRQELVERKSTLSEVRRKHDSLIAMLDNLHGMTFRCELRERMMPVYVSRGCEHLTGFTQEQICSGEMVLRDLGYPQDMTEADRQYNEALREQRPFNLRFRLLHKDGAVRWVQVVGRGLYTAEGRLLGSAGYYLDITDLEQAESERHRLMSEWKTKSSDLEKLLQIVSHDLRAPVLGIAGYGRALRRRCQELVPAKDDRVHELLGGVLGAAEHMDRLLDGLIRFVRLGRVESDPEPLEMRFRLQRIVQALSYQIDQADATVHIEEQLPNCYGDAMQVDQLFTNLMDNALKYLQPDRPGRIAVSGRMLGNQVEYCVSDNGRGIPFELQERIFQPFQRVENNGKVAGEGLGLAIVQRLAELNHGDIRVESVPGAGSRFYVVLPRNREAVVHLPDEE